QEEIFKKFHVQVPAAKATKKYVKVLEMLRDFLRHTYAGSLEHFSDFTERQIKFLRFYAKEGRRRVAHCVKLAGYNYVDPDSAFNQGMAILRKPYAEDLLTLFEMEEKARMKVTVEDVVAWFNKIATAAMESGDFTNANRAMENLAKYLGMFVERKEIVHRDVTSREELDARIAELTAILKDVEPEIERRLSIN
ncbi:MAG: hypothetical protein NZ534_12285, partial [Bacteroidia bacterium]|nr:hypothetical protein [Bacteroidia bacterium]